MAELGSAYVNIIPKAPGIEKELKKLLGDGAAGAGSPAGRSAGSSFISAFKKIVAGAAIGKVVKDAFSAGGEYEQLAGGVEKIFAGMDTSKIIADAAEAYKTLNLSANDYLAVINDVGASFAASMGAEAGYKTAQKGLQAISDYASGTGKSVDLLSQKFTMISRSTSSYMSIADQFSGILPATSADFLAQAKAAGFLSSSYKELTQVPIAEYQQAVASMLELGVENLNLTGNTAKETATTLTGSLGAVKASWENVLAAMTTGNGLEGAVSSLGQSAGALINNVLTMTTTLMAQLPQLFSSVAAAVAANAPLLMESGGQLVSMLINGFVTGLPTAIIGISGLISQLASSISANGANFLMSGMELIGQLVSGILSTIPTLATSAASIVNQLLVAITTNAPSLISAGGQLLQQVVTGITTAIPQIVASAVQIAGDLLMAFMTNAPTLIAGGIELIVQLINGLVQAIPTLLDKVPEIFSQMSAAFAATDWASIGNNLVNGIIAGVQAAASALWETVSNLATTALNKVKSVLGIASPSKAFENEVGRWIPEGMAVGIETNLMPVKASVDAMAATARAELQRATAPGMSINAAFGNASGYESSEIPIVENHVAIEFRGSLAQLARVLQPYIVQEGQRRGEALVT